MSKIVTLLSLFLLVLVSARANELPCGGAEGLPHSNGGGYVANTAKVEASVLVELNASVCELSEIYGDAKITDSAIISGRAKIFTGSTVSGNSKVFGRAKLTGTVNISGKAEVFGHAQLSDNASVADNAKIYGNAQLRRSSSASGESKVYGDIVITDEVSVAGNSVLCDNKTLRGNVSIDSGSEYCTSFLAPELSVSPNQFDFNGMSAGDISPNQIFLVSNNGGKGKVCSDVSLTGINADEFALDVSSDCASTLASGGTCQIVAKATPQSPGDKEATISYSCDGEIASVLLTASVFSPELSIFPEIYDFGTVVVGGSSASNDFNISNNGQGPATECQDPVISGPDADQFELVSHNCTATMSAGSSCSVEVRALPLSEGLKNATVERSCDVGGNISSSFSVSVPTPIPNLSLTPNTFDFGVSVVGNQSATSTFTLTNNGTGPTSLCSSPVLTGLNPDQFLIVSDTCGTIDLGAEGGSCTVDIAAFPSSLGAKAVTLTRTCLIGGTIRTNTNGVTTTSETAVINLAIDQSSLDFSDVLVGTSSATQTLTISNSGNSQASGCSVPTLTGGASEFSILGSSTCNGSNIPANGSCTIDIAANPTALGAQSGGVELICTAGGTLTATLTANGVSPSLAMTPIAPDFSQVDVGQSSAPIVMIITNSGTASATGCSAPFLGGANPSEFSISNDLCASNDLADGASCTFELTASPTNRGNKSTLVRRICSNGGEVNQTATVEGIGPELAWTPASNDFGSLNINETSGTTSFVLNNTGDSAATGCSSLNISGVNSAEFNISSNTCLGSDIPALGSCSVDVAFAPTTEGAKSVNLEVSCTSGGVQVASLSGVATAPNNSISPSSYDFGQILVGNSSAPQILTVSNSGSGPATGCALPSLTGTDAGEFSINLANSSCDASDISSGGSCTIEVTATPTTGGISGDAAVNLNCSTGGLVSASLSVEGTGPSLAMTPTSFSYADTNVGSSSALQQFTVTNSGTADALNCLAPSLTGTNLADFTIEGSGSCTTGTLAVGASCTIDATFSPQSAGTNKSANINYSCDSVSTFASLSGDAIGSTLDAGTIEIFISNAANPMEVFIFSVDEDAGPGRTVQSITWDFGDGSDPVTVPFDQEQADDGDSQEVFHNYIFAGASATYTITKTVKDDLGNTSQVSQPFTFVKGTIPVSKFSLSTLTINVGDTVTLDASASNDPDGKNIIFYEFEVGDDLIETTNPISTYTFNDAGEYEIGLLTVDEDRHASAVFAVTVYVGVSIPEEGHVPLANFSTTDSLGAAPLSVIYDAKPYSFDLDGTIATHIFDVGDKLIGKRFYEQKPTDPAQTITFGVEGNYTVDVTAIDNDGNYNPPDGDAAKTTYVWATTTPEPEFFAFKGAINNVFFNASATRGAAAWDSFLWDFGDGNYSFGSNTDHFYDTSGTKTVTLTVLGVDGTVVQKSKKIFISPTMTNPDAYFNETSGGEILVGDNVDFDGVGSFNNETGQIPGLTIDFGDGSPLVKVENANQTITHTYSGSAKWVRARGYIENMAPPEGNGFTSVIEKKINVVDGSRPVDSVVFDATPVPGFETTLDASASTDDGSIVKYTWEIYESGLESPYREGGALNPTSVKFGSVITHTFDSTAVVRLYIEDNVGNITEKIMNIDPQLPNTEVSISTGDAHSCAVLLSGEVKCWGQGLDGRLGYDNTDDVGAAGTTVSGAEEVPLGVDFVATQVVAGGSHSCALSVDGKVRCWGKNDQGQLGYDDTLSVGDGTAGRSIIDMGDVSVGDTVIELSAGKNHTCALLVTDTVRCWGSNSFGQLGYDNTSNIGDGVGASIVSAGDNQLPVVADMVSAGDEHTCAVVDDTGAFALRCWGNGANGRLGYGNTQNVGDDPSRSLATIGNISLGGIEIDMVSAGGSHTCVIDDNSDVRCWGNGANGRLGNDGTADIGDDELPSSISVINYGGTANSDSVFAGGDHTCLAKGDGNLMCWGANAFGQLGYDDTLDVGDGTVGRAIVDLGNVSYSVGLNANWLTVGTENTCVGLSTENFRCWGKGGENGSNDTGNIGDGTVGRSIEDIGDIELYEDKKVLLSEVRKFSRLKRKKRRAINNYLKAIDMGMFPTFRKVQIPFIDQVTQTKNLGSK